MDNALITIAACLIVLIMFAMFVAVSYVGLWLLWGALKDAYRYFMEN